jgi:hypothetical protein
MAGLIAARERGRKGDRAPGIKPEEKLMIEAMLKENPETDLRAMLKMMEIPRSTFRVERFQGRSVRRMERMLDDELFEESLGGVGV